MTGHGASATNSIADGARTQTLLSRGRRLCTQSAELPEKSTVRVGEIREHLTRSRRMIQGYSTRRPDVMRAMVRQRLRAGRLPHDSAPVIVGGPGAGGACVACSRPLEAKHLVMELPSPAAELHLHADCFMLWDQLRRSTR